MEHSHDLAKHHGAPATAVGLQQQPLCLHGTPLMPEYPHSTRLCGSVWQCGNASVGTNKLQFSAMF